MVIWLKKQATLIMFIVMAFGFGVTAGGFGGWQMCRVGGFKAEIETQKKELKGIDAMDTKQSKRRKTVKKTREGLRHAKAKDTRKCSALTATYPRDYTDRMRRFQKSQGS